MHFHFALHNGLVLFASYHAKLCIHRLLMYEAFLVPLPPPPPKWCEDVGLVLMVMFESHCCCVEADWERAGARKRGILCYSVY